MKKRQSTAAYRIVTSDKADRHIVNRIKKVGPSEVARIADVHRSTVHKFLGGELWLPEETAKRILEAAGIVWESAVD